LLSLAAVLHLGLVLTASLCLICFCFANYFYEGGITFYNSLLVDVSNSKSIGKISGLGVAIGYLGAICGLLLVEPLTQGKLIAGVTGREYAFLPTALLFLLFALPTFLWVREQRHPIAVSPDRESYWQRLKTSLKETRKYPGVLRFLVADFIVEDAIATTIAFMAVYSESVVGFQASDKIILFICSTGFAFLGSLFFGWLSDKIHSKRALIIALCGWVAVLTAAVVSNDKTQFYVIGGFVGIFLGAVWTTSRPLLNSLVPAEKLGQFYGLYTLSGRSAATIGPLIWGAVAYFGKPDQWLGNGALSFFQLFGITSTEELANAIHHRLALFSLLVIMLIGLIAMLRVPMIKIDKHP
jgi:UMF1 family MFS transporter